jgi:uncharacterized protein YbjT (DUF2867 family)
MKDQTILVTGATGHQGAAIARELLRRGHFNVRALARDAHKPSAMELRNGGAELMEGDFDDRASLDRALQGVHGVFSVQGFEGGLEAEIRQGKAIADAAKSAGVQHFVYSSVGSAERNTGIPHFDSKFQIEQYIRALDLPYTIMRPVFFFFNYDGLRPQIEKGILPQPLKPDTKLQQLCEDDYGRMVGEVLERREEFIGAALEVASVTMTMAETARTLSRVLEQDVKYEQIPFEAFEKQAGKEVAIMFRWFEADGYRADLAALERKFGPPTDFKSYLRAHGWSPVAAQA